MLGFSYHVVENVFERFRYVLLEQKPNEVKGDRETVMQGKGTLPCSCKIKKNKETFLNQKLKLTIKLLDIKMSETAFLLFKIFNVFCFSCRNDIRMLQAKN